MEYYYLEIMSPRNLYWFLVQSKDPELAQLKTMDIKIDKYYEVKVKKVIVEIHNNEVVILDKELETYVTVRPSQFKTIEGFYKKGWDKILLKAIFEDINFK